MHSPYHWPPPCYWLLPDASDQMTPQPLKKLKHDVSVFDLLKTSLLSEGTRLRSIPDAYDEIAVVHPDGQLKVRGEIHKMPQQRLIRHV